MKSSKHFLLFALATTLTIIIVALMLPISPDQSTIVNAAPVNGTPTVNKNVNAKYVNNFQAAKTAVPNRLLPLDGSGKFPLAVIPHGSGSGLDADKLDGKDSNAFAVASHTHYGQKWTGNSNIGLEVVSNNTAALKGTWGTGSGVDLPEQGGVWGDASASGIGVLGTSEQGVGVAGIGSIFTGVVGQSTYDAGVNGVSISGDGVEGSSTNGYAMHAYGPTAQDLNKGGWVKALALMSGGTLSRCYNSQGFQPNSTPPCGFTLGGSGGNYTITFPFDVNTRFVSVTPYWGSGSAVIPVVSFPSSNVIRIQTYSSGTTLVDSGFFLTIY